MRKLLTTHLILLNEKVWAVCQSTIYTGSPRLAEGLRSSRKHSRSGSDNACLMESHEKVSTHVTLVSI